MKLRLLVYLFLTHLLFCDLFAEGDPNRIFCNMTESGQLLAPPVNGNFKPAKTGSGEYFRILIAFAQFAEDSLPDFAWPSKELPVWRNDIIDNSVSTTYPNGYRDETLSDYFDKASLGRFDFIGDVYQDTIIIPSTMPYDSSNLYVLQELKENIPDFRRYDNWNCTGSSPLFAEGSGDGYIDMLIVIYRRAVDSTFGIEGGIASLNMTDIFKIDKNRNIFIKEGFLPSKERGGITTCAGLSDRFSMVGHLAHEYGHYMFGEHTNMGGLMSGNYYNGTYMMNAYERAYQGYITFKTPTTDGEQDTLRDFVKYGDALKIPIFGGTYFIVENHQRLHKYDQIMRGQPLDGNYNLTTKVGSGIYIWNFNGGADGYYPSNSSIKSADGAWNWAFDGTFYAPGFYIKKAWQDTVPKYKRISVNRNTGLSDKDPIIGFWHGEYIPKWVDTNPFTGEYELTLDCKGEENDAFNLGYNQLFTPWSNPSSFLVWQTNISLQLISKFGTENNYILKFYNTQASALALPPSKPTFVRSEYTSSISFVTTWEGNTEPDVISGGGYNIYREIFVGSSLYSSIKLNSSLITSTTFTDYMQPGYFQFNVDQSLRYKIEAVDRDGNTSLSAVGNTIHLGKVLYGTINSATLGGLYTCLGTLTVENTATFVILPGTNIRFDNGASFRCYGRLIAQGNSGNQIFFTRLGSSGTWGGILLSGYGVSYSNLNNLNIQYANAIYVMNTSGVQIQNSTFKNNNTNITFYNAGGSVTNNRIIGGVCGITVMGASNVTCDDNIITASTSGIVYTLASSGNLGGNDIAYCTAEGVYITNSSSPMFRNVTSHLERNNRITNSWLGVSVYASYPDMYDGLYCVGYNSIQDNYYADLSYTGSSGMLNAAGNYWNDGNPANAGIEGRAYVITSPYLSSDPWTTPIPPRLEKLNSQPLPSSSYLASAASSGITPSADLTNSNDADTKESTDSMLEGIKLREEKKLNEAMNYFISYLRKNPENKRAYVELYNCSSKETVGEIIKYFKSLPGNASEEKLLLAYLYLKKGDVNSAKEVNNAMIGKNISNSISAAASLNNFYIALYNENSPKTAESILKNITDKKGIFNNTDISLAKYALETFIAADVSNYDRFLKESYEENSISKPEDFKLEQNYPNPFNPVTTIKYALPQNSNVIIEVFSVLGEKVATLVNETKTAGYYETKFDGSNLSSGIYIYRLTANSLESGEVFVKSAKMMLIK